MTKLTEKQKMRVKIARDVLKQLDAKKIKPAHGTYFKWHGEDTEAVDKKKPCRVCALGSMFVAEFGASAAGASSFNEMGPYEYNPLCATFGLQTLEAIEDDFEFEGRSIRQVMNNIISHRGEYVPSRKTAAYME